MKLVKVAAAAVNQTPFDWDNNQSNIARAIEEARRQGVSLVCLPELCITGYGCEDDFFRTDLHERAWQMLKQIAPLTGNMVVSVGLPVLYHNALFNCAAVLADGRLLGLVAKQNLAGDGIHYEPRWFDAWQEGVVSHLIVDGESIPIGDIQFDIGGIKIGFEICEDAWVGRRPGARLAAKGVDIFLNPSASHFAMGKLETRKRLVLEGSRAFSATYIYSNLLGNEAGRAIYDGGSIIASGGKLQAVGPRFSFADFELTTAVVDIDHTRMAQARTYSYRPELAETTDDCVRIDFQYPRLDVPPSQCVDSPAWEASANAQFEEFARSLALGLFDYLRKTRSRGYTVSLSGGADSSAVCCLVSLMTEFAVQQLGIDRVKERLGYIPEIHSANSAEDLVKLLLTCAYQATENSSEQSWHSARTLADALGATFYRFDISELVKGYVNMVSTAVARKLTWETDDIALQNIQARVRSPGIWLLANITNSVLLCTSNRSEGALGYCTMDGDTSGGLAPIAGVDKNFIRRWLRWMQNEGPMGLRAFRGLTSVNLQTPGPELRPLEAHQAGEEDLMPYDVLEAIEEAAIENNQSVADCFLLMCARFPQYSREQIEQWVEKFFVLWSRNQWKRERLAPALHVASRNLDPRTWRRSPILSGGFRKEIAEMKSIASRLTDERTNQQQPRRQGSDAARDRQNNRTSSNGKHNKQALVVIDVQNGFSSCGELPVADAESIVPIINKLMERFDTVVATQDWHPANHVSFAERHGKKPGESHRIGKFDQPLFPPHCVQGTNSAQFIAGLRTELFHAIFQKGTHPDIDSFSAFKDNLGGKATDIEHYLRDNGVDELFLCGLATNYCVMSTALDAIRAGFKVHVVIDACRGIDNPAGSVEASIAKMRDAGIDICHSESVFAHDRT
jgi:NAD+ synthase (glutamine-hydrolysing)